MSRIVPIAFVSVAAALLLPACNRPSDLPDMGVSRIAVAFEAPGGSGEPAPQVVYVVNTGRGSLVAPSAEIVYQQGSGWLAAAVTGGGAPYGVQLHATSAGLGPGVYRATVTLTCSNASASPAQVSVTLTVPDPRFTLSTQSLAIDAPRGGGDPAPATFQVLNAGRGTIPVPQIDVTYLGTAGWLTTQVDGASNAYDVTLRAHVSAFDSGVYTATITVRAPGSEAPPRTLGVTLTVPPAEVSASRREVRFVGGTNGADPSPVVLTVTNAGGGRMGPLHFELASDGWSGLEVSVRGSEPPFEVTLEPHQATSSWPPVLGPGTYGATVTLWSDDSVNRETVGVTLYVPPPVIQLASTEVSFAAYASCGLPKPQMVQVTNAGGSALGTLVATVAPDGASWLEAYATAAPYAVYLTITALPSTDPGLTTSTTVRLTAGFGDVAPVDLVVRFDELVPAEATTTRVTSPPLLVAAQAGMDDPLPRLLTIETRNGCIPEPTIDIESATSAGYTWLRVENAPWWWRRPEDPYRHEFAVHTATSGMAPGDVRTATLRITAPGYAASVPLTLTLGAIEPAGPMNDARERPTLTALPDGRALASGGLTPGSVPTNAVEVFDPATRAWTSLAPMSRSRWGHGAAALDGGDVVVCGGWTSFPGSGAPDATCEALTGAGWSQPWSMLRPRGSVTLVQLPGRRLLAVSPGEPAEIVDPSGAGTILADVTGTSAIAVGAGRILVAGGGAAAWEYWPETDRFVRTGDKAVLHDCPALLPFSDVCVLAVGGTVAGATGYGAEVWCGGGWEQTSAETLTFHSDPRSFAPLSGGEVIALAGAAPGTTSRNIERLRYASWSWNDLGPLDEKTREGVAAVALRSGMVLVTGGLVPGESPASREAFTW